MNVLHKPDLLHAEPASQLQVHSGRDDSSLAVDVLCVDPDHGDFSVREDSPALALGFVNFPMNQFGVRKASLKKRARTPKLPQIGAMLSSSSRSAQLVNWGRCKVKNIVGLGEVSASGLPSESGVIIETIPWGSWQNEQGFEVSDVLIELNGEQVDSVDDLLTHYNEIHEGESFEVTIFRAQQRMVLQAIKMSV